MFVLFMFSSQLVLVFHLVLMHAVISTLGVVLIVLIVTPTDWCTIPTGQSLKFNNLNNILYVWYIDVIAFSQRLGGIYMFNNGRGG